MANHLSAKKAHRQNLKRNLINKSRLSRIKTYIKRVLTAIAGGTRKDVESTFIEAQSEIMKGVNKKVLKKNTASRKVSSIAQKIKKMKAISE